MKLPLALLLLAACGGSAPPPRSADTVASDPETGGEVVDQVAMGGKEDSSDPCTGGEVDGYGDLGKGSQGENQLERGGTGGAGGGGKPLPVTSSGKGKLGTPTVTGKLEMSQVISVVTEELDRLTQCYDRFLESNPGKAYAATLELTIARDGTVSAAKAKATTPETETDTCLFHVVGSMTFPRTGGGTVTVAYPISFAP